MSLRSKYYSFKRGVHNLVKWFPVIWKDRDWDWEYLMEIIKFKLKNMEYLFRNHGISMGSEHRADEMKEVIELIDKILNHNYLKETSKGNEDLLHMNANNMTYEQKEKLHGLFDKEDKLIQNDINKTFDLIKSNIRKWWD